MAKRTLLIVGHPRSGTTLLSRMLEAHPSIQFTAYEFNEFYFFERIAPLYALHRQERYKILLQDFLEHPNIQYPEPYHPPKEKLRGCGSSYPEFVEGLFDDYRSHYGSTVVGVKGAHYHRENIRFFLKHFPDTYVIHIVRDPRDAILSLNNGWIGSLEVIDYLSAGRRWKQEVQEIRQLGSRFRGYQEIRYEDLLDDPETELRAFCAGMELPFDSNMLSPAAKSKEVWGSHQLLQGGIKRDNREKWRQKLTNIEIAKIEAGAGDELAHYGYGSAFDSQPIPSLAANIRAKLVPLIRTWRLVRGRHWSFHQYHYWSRIVAKRCLRWLGIETSRFRRSS